MIIFLFNDDSHEKQTYQRIILCWVRVGYDEFSFVLIWLVRKNDFTFLIYQTNMIIFGFLSIDRGKIFDKKNSTKTQFQKR